MHILEGYLGYAIQTSITKSSHFTVCTDIGFKMKNNSAYCESIYKHLKLRGVAFLGVINQGHKMWLVTGGTISFISIREYLIYG